ncbi:hypothetical protein Ancab_024946 [Ancistrocladus abbreviatus]
MEALACRSFNWTCSSNYEVGYDALLLGVSLLRLAMLPGVHFRTDAPCADLANKRKLRKCINLLYLSWNATDASNLSGGHLEQLLFEFLALKEGFEMSNDPISVLHPGRGRGRGSWHQLEGQIGPTERQSVTEDCEPSGEEIEKSSSTLKTVDKTKKMEAQILQNHSCSSA